MPLTESLKIAMLHHVRYEITHCLVIPAWRDDAPMLKEAIFLSFFVHARNLIHFFEKTRGEGDSDDVYASDYGFSRRAIALPEEDRIRFGKDMMHITSKRERHTVRTKPWPIQSTYAALKPVGVEFCQHVVSHFGAKLSPAERGAWSQILGILLDSGDKIVTVAEQSPSPQV